MIRRRRLHRLELLAVVSFAFLAAGCTQVQSKLAETVGRGEPGASIAIDRRDGSLLKAERGLFRTLDQGATWQPVSLPPATPTEDVSLVAAAPVSTSPLYAGGPGVGVLRSTDDGATWTKVSDGLPSQDVRALAVHTFRPDTLYVSVPGQGVFRTEDAGGRWQKMDDGPEAPVLALTHSPLEGSMNTGWLYASTPDGPYLSMDCF